MRTQLAELGDGVVLHYRVDGDADRPWLVLANSIAADTSMWDDVVAHLTGQFRILRFDARGHGQSPDVSARCDLDALSEDVLRLLHHLSIREAHLAGISLGAMTQFGVALRQPSLALSLTYCNAIVDADAWYREFWLERSRTVMERGMSAIAQATCDRWLTAEAGGELRESVVAMIQRTSVGGFCRAAGALTGLAFGKDLRRLAVPVHFVAGSRDIAAPASILRDCVPLVRNGRFSLIDGAAHLSSLERPEQLAAAIVRSARPEKP